MDLSAESLQYQYLSPVVVSEVLHTLGVGWTVASFPDSCAGEEEREPGTHTAWERG